MTKITIANEEIVLDKDLLSFNEHNINQYLQNFSSNYNDFQVHHANAQFAYSKYEDRYEAIFAEKFREYKQQNFSDKWAEASAKCDSEVKEALECMRLAKRNVNLLNGFLRSMDRSHEDAMQFCYNLRKEMEKIFPRYS